MNDAGTTIGGTLSFPDFLPWAVAFFKSPRAFFRSMEKKGGYLTPCLYAAGWLLASALVGFFISLFRPAPAGMGRAVQVASLFLGPLLGVLFGFLLAAVLFVVWHLMGSKEDYQTSFRVWAFMAPLAVASALLAVVPFLNVLVLVYGFYLLVLASEEVHGLPRERSWAVWGVVGALVVVFLLIVFAAGLAFRNRAGTPNFSSMPASFPVNR